MNRHLKEVFEEIKELSDEGQEEAAQILLALLDRRNPDLRLSPEQIADIEDSAPEDAPYATDKEVRASFARLLK